MTKGLRIYGYDEGGQTYEIRISRKDSFTKSGDQTRVKGEVHVPETCKALACEGDEGWTPLPGFVTKNEVSRRDSNKRKNDRAKSAPAKTAARH